ncbi:type II toxin-antitoxin system RelE/ParE family toxin [Thiospirochaeta perfilievii]|uniref:Type II toxin-antitoxin system RelE/ParE family toxin n=1 Tax=Thiospirochaeta perfilievii TaxID=252967 RepID=A0A5C1QA54_9SPIO|nr:type II toxin-antitoxin system RelE/ParE family toxin [Thiospirochaeta perfilievii]QEN04357.1 type II toxin-antitoxin system RelE/ParE family toxin [Thiospirochaeta perfilievii]
MVAWTDKAKSSLRNIFNYIKEDSPFYAKEVKKKFIFESKKLSDFLKLGRIVPEVEDDNIRELFIYSYRMIYQIVDNNVFILTIIHSIQEFSNL